MRIAFFDVDHTLVRGSTAWHCADALWREGIITPSMLLTVAWGHGRHKLGLLNFEEAYARAVIPFVGMTQERLDATLDEAFQYRVRPALFREAVARLRAHHEAGERIVLLSASSWYLLQRFRRVLPIDDVIGFRQRMLEGRLVNDFDRPIPYGPNKLILARRYAEGQGVDLRDCAFYSDSSSDATLLRAVGRPFVVNPDPWLRIEARLRGWPILHFRGTTGRQDP